MIVKSKQPKKQRAGKQGGRMQASRIEPQGDTYRKKGRGGDTKLASATLCPDCKAVFRDGRWQWSHVPAPSGWLQQVCPACQRIRDHYPAGEVRITGEFARAHREELIAHIRNLEAKEKAEHPLNRLDRDPRARRRVGRHHDRRASRARDRHWPARCVQRDSARTVGGAGRVAPRALGALRPRVT